MKNARGFTIVELLIVIVVIGILAAIVIVAFNGVQNRANDTAVQADLSANYKQMNLQKADTGIYPVSNPTAAMGLRYSKGSYDSGFNNAYYCASSDGAEAALAGRSKSGKQFVYGSKTGLIEMTTSWSGSNSCIAAGLVGADLRSNGYTASTSTWSAWTN